MEHFKSFKLLENWVKGKKLTDIFVGCTARQAIREQLTV